MPYPPLYNRVSNFRQAENNDLPIDTAKVDSEYNNLQTCLNALNRFVRLHTDASGRLVNVASATALSLAGSQAFTATAYQTNFDTTIPWESSFSTASVLATAAGLRVPVVSVANQGGNLRVTLAAQPANTAVAVYAFSAGQALLSTLASDANGDGASLIGIEDADGIYAATTVEDALAEVMTDVNDLITSLGTLSNYFLKNGSRAMTGDIDMGDYKVTNMGDATDPEDAVTLGQIQTYIDVWDNLQSFYLKRDGTTAMAGDLNFGNHKGTNLADADLGEDQDAVNVRTMRQALSEFGSIPVGAIQMYAGESAPANWLLCNGAAYKEADYESLAGILPSSLKGSAQVANGCRPAHISVTITPGGGSNGTVTAAAIVDGGAGYSTAPSLLIVSVPATITTSEAADAFTNATLTCSLGSAASVDANGNATGGVVTSVSVGTAGAGFDSRTDVRVRPWVSTPDEAFAKLPSTMFRVPDFRGSLPRGTGAASRVPGMSFGFASNYGDGYDGLSDSTIGRHGGEEKHTLTVDELAAHQHRQASGSASSGSFVQQSDNTGQFAYSDTAGGNIPHNTLPPYVIVSFIIKAK